MKFREIKTSEDVRAQIEGLLFSGELVSGEYVAKVEDKMLQISEAREAIAVSSGTMALKIACDALGLKAGDMVIVPDVTFIACASVLMELDITPVFVDIHPETFLLDEVSTVKAMATYGDRIKAIMAVRLGGEEIPEWVWGIGIPVIVDSAHSMDAHDVRAVATCYSFYPTKIVSGVEGGLIATNHAGIAAACRRLRLFGFTEGTRIAQELGYKGNMTNVSACLILSNLGQLSTNLRNRMRIRDLYNERLGLNHRGLGMYMVLVEKPDELCARIPAIRHYPKTLSEMTTGRAFGVVAQEVVKRLVSLPFHEHMFHEDVDIICATISSL